MNSHTVILVAFLKPQQQQFAFTKWPNHLTIVPYFQTNNLQNLLVDISTICMNVHAISYTVGTVDYFGPEKKVRVSRLIPNKDLSDLHESLLKIALQNDQSMVVNYCGKNYKPHITHNNAPYPKEGEDGAVQTLYLVENHSPKIQKKGLQEKSILAVINLT